MKKTWTKGGTQKKIWRKKERSSQTPAVILDGEKQEIMSSLPDDIIVHILSMLPVKSILRFRCVCKYWCDLLKHPNFTQYHLKNSIQSSKLSYLSIKCEDNEINMLIRKSPTLTTFEDDYFETIDVIEIESLMAGWRNHSISTHGSCNGLILMSGSVDEKDLRLCLWNPATKDFKEIIIDYRYEISNADSSPVEHKYGLGYNCNTDVYKIVKVSPVYNGYDSNDRLAQKVCCGSRVQVYTLGPDSWKPLPNMVPYEIVWCSYATYVDGDLFYEATPCPYNTEEGCRSRVIIYFDIRDENFREVPLTPQVNKSLFSSTLGALGGCLCIVFSGSCRISSNNEVWVMKDRKVRESWTRLFIIQLPVEEIVDYCWMNLKWEFKNGKLLFEASGGDATTYFVIYDLVQRKVSKIYRIPERRSSMETFVESLVSISAGKQEVPTLQNQAVRTYRRKRVLRKYHLEEKVCITRWE